MKVKNLFSCILVMITFSNSLFVGALTQKADTDILTNQEILEEYQSYYISMEQSYIDNQSNNIMKIKSDMDNTDSIYNQASVKIEENGEVVLLTSLFVTQPNNYSAGALKKATGGGADRYYTVAYGRLYQKLSYDEKYSGGYYWSQIKSVNAKVVSLNAGYTCTGIDGHCIQTAARGDNWESRFNYPLDEIYFIYAHDKWVRSDQNAYMCLESTFKFSKGASNYSTRVVLEVSP